MTKFVDARLRRDRNVNDSKSIREYVLYSTVPKALPCHTHRDEVSPDHPFARPFLLLVHANKFDLILRCISTPCIGTPLSSTSTFQSAYLTSDLTDLDVHERSAHRARTLRIPKKCPSVRSLVRLAMNQPHSTTAPTHNSTHHTTQKTAPDPSYH